MLYQQINWHIPFAFNFKPIPSPIQFKVCGHKIWCIRIKRNMTQTACALHEPLHSIIQKNPNINWLCVCVFARSRYDLSVDKFWYLRAELCACRVMCVFAVLRVFVFARVIYFVVLSRFRLGRDEYIYEQINWLYCIKGLRVHLCLNINHPSYVTSKCLVNRYILNHCGYLRRAPHDTFFKKLLNHLKTPLQVWTTTI